MRDRALKLLYGHLRRKRVALGLAEQKPRVSQDEIESIKSSIEVIEWIIGKVLEGEDGSV